MAVGKHLMCCFFYSLSLSLFLSLSLSHKEISIFPLHYFSLSFSLSHSLSQKLCILFIHSSHFTPPHSKAQEQEAPSKYHQTERENLQNSNSQIPISSHTTQHKSLLNCILACSVIHTIQDLQLELDGIESNGVGNYCF